MRLREVRVGASVVFGLIAGAGIALGAEESLEDNQCVACHGTPDLWEGETLHLFVKVDELAADVHWQQGIRCQDCHGGNANTFELREAHAIEDGFRKVETPADIPGFCGHCHSNAEYMRRYNPDARTNHTERFWSSVHGKHLKETGGTEAATCTSCHPKHAERPLADPQSAVHPARLPETCGTCHRQQLVNLRKSVHHKAGPEDDSGVGTLLDCLQCHGTDVHGMRPVGDKSSPVYVNNQIGSCGRCHEKPFDEYLVSVHGHGLQNSGLVSTAVCANCHGAHAVFSAKDPRSVLHNSRVAETCGACHRFIEQRLEASVHGRGNGPGRSGEKPVSGGTELRTPSCTDCHVGHDLANPKSDAFRLGEADRCGTCHVELTVQYRQSMHGALTDLGYGPGAKCADCHGAHDILPVADPNSRLAPAHREATCAQCHPGISPRLLAFDPHADHGTGPDRLCCSGCT